MNGVLKVLLYQLQLFGYASKGIDGPFERRHLLYYVRQKRGTRRFSLAFLKQKILLCPGWVRRQNGIDQSTGQAESVVEEPLC